MTLSSRAQGNQDALKWSRNQATPVAVASRFSIDHVEGVRFGTIMDTSPFTYRPVAPLDLQKIIDLWHVCGVTRFWMDPQAEIDANCVKDPLDVMLRR